MDLLLGNFKIDSYGTIDFTIVFSLLNDNGLSIKINLYQPIILIIQQYFATKYHFKILKLIVYVNILLI